jgi:hypothetical protein
MKPLEFVCPKEINNIVAQYNYFTEESLQMWVTKRSCFQELPATFWISAESLLTLPVTGLDEVWRVNFYEGIKRIYPHGNSPLCITKVCTGEWWLLEYKDQQERLCARGNSLHDLFLDMSTSMKARFQISENREGNRLYVYE